MRKATYKDRELVVGILYRAYHTNPSVLWVIKKTGNIDRRIRFLCEYCFDTICPIGGVYITSDNKGVCMIYPINDLRFRWKNLLDKLKLALRVVGLARAMAIMNREAYIKKHRKPGNFLYFWMIAVDPDIRGIEAIQEMRDETYAMSAELNLPIYAETTVDRNKMLYERYGFETYHEWQVPGKDMKVWFMNRLPDKN